MEHNKDRYRAKRLESEVRAEFMRAGLKLMNEILHTPAIEEKKDEELQEIDEDNKENDESQML